MIKKATGDWQRRIPPWATTSTCDLRRYRGPYANGREKIVQQGRALDRLAAALQDAARTGAEFLIVRCGDRAPRRDALQPLLRDYLLSQRCERFADPDASSDYPDRIVVVLRELPWVDPSPVCPIEPARRPD